MPRETLQPDAPLADLLRNIAAAVANGSAAGERDHNLDALIMDAVLRRDLLSWGRKDGATDRELIPQLAWEIGKFDHRTGKLVYRHPDSPFPEEYGDIAFSSIQLNPWLGELASRRRRPSET